MRWIGLPLLAALGLGLFRLAGAGAHPAPAIDEAVPRLVWPAGPMEVHVALRQPIDAATAATLVGRLIPFRALSSPDAAGTGAPAADASELGSIRIAAVERRDQGRTLVLITDPHPRSGRYTIPAPEGAGRPEAWSYPALGVEAAWTPAEGTQAAAWSGWWPVLDPARARAATAGSAEHERLFATLAQPGTLRLTTFVQVPPDGGTLRIAATAPVEGSVNFEPLTVQAAAGEHRAEVAVAATTEPVECTLSVPTGAGGQAPTLTVTLQRTGASGFEPIAPERLNPAWVPPALPTAADVPAPPYDLAGGDPKRGAEVFRGETAKCSSCHQIGGQGVAIGPALDSQADREPAAIYRDIAEPSAVIHPAYLPFTVALKNGQVLVGVVRAEGADKLRVLDISAQETLVPRSEVEELRPSGTSVMPVGLAGAIGEAGMRDLIAYLKAPKGRP